MGDESGIPEHAVSTIGQLSEFQTDNERIMDDLKRVQLFFKVNGIAEGELVLVLLLTAIEERCIPCLETSWHHRSQMRSVSKNSQ